MPITVDPEYLQDVLDAEEALIRSIARSVYTDPKLVAAAGTAASAETVQQVRKTVEWLADRTSIAVIIP